MLSEGTWLTKKEEEEAFAAEFCLFWLELLWERRKSGAKAFTCLREVLQFLFSRDIFPPAWSKIFVGLYSEDKPLCKEQMYEIWIQKDPDSSAYLMGLNSTGFLYLFPVAVAVITFHIMTFLGEKHDVSETGTTADCRAAPHQLKQGILPTTELSQSGFIIPRRHKNIIYTIFGGKMPRICVSTSSVSCVTPGSTVALHSSCSQLSDLLNAVWVLIVGWSQRLLVSLCPPLAGIWATQLSTTK